jgi:protein ImuB
MLSSKVPRRIVALWFPHLPTDRLQRSKKTFSTAAGSPPLVVAAKVDNAFRISAIDPKALSLGLVLGQALASARAMLPALDVAGADELADLQLLEHIANWCDRFTPLVALDPPHGILLDVTGAAHLFGGEQMLLNKIRESLRTQGFIVLGALAGTAMAARALARCRDGIVVPSGEESKAVAPLPIAALNLDPGVTHAFRRAGLKTVGQAASRKRSEIASRFGAATVFTLDEALGHAERPISPRLPRPDYWKEHILQSPS